MVRSRFDLGSTSKTLNLSLLRFNERSGFENLVDYYYISCAHLHSLQPKKKKNDIPHLFVSEERNISKATLLLLIILTKIELIGNIGSKKTL